MHNKLAERLVVTGVGSTEPTEVMRTAPKSNFPAYAGSINGGFANDLLGFDPEQLPPPSAHLSAPSGPDVELQFQFSLLRSVVNQSLNIYQQQTGLLDPSVAHSPLGHSPAVKARI